MDYKHQYESMKKMVTMYQDEIVPGLWEKIKELEKQMPKWIPVTERLPDTFGTFVVAVRISTRQRLYNDSADFDPFTKTWKTSLFWGKDLKITHWMPLPEPPKEIEYE